MPAPCWDQLCASDCFYCRYKQDRYRTGSSKPCFLWFRERGVAKRCRLCAFYLREREKNPALPEDPMAGLPAA